MSIYLAFSETDGLDSVSTDVVNVTSGSGVVAGINRAAIHFSKRAIGYATLPLAMAEGWVHGRVVPRQAATASPGTNADYIFAVQDELGNSIAGFYQNNNNSFSMNWLATYFGDPSIGTVNATSGVIIGTPSGGYDVDLHFKIHQTDGFLRWYVGGVLVREVLGDTQPSTSDKVSRLLLRATGSATVTAASDTVTISQVIVSDLPTIGARLHTLALSAGTVNQWLGAVTDLNAADHTTATFMSEDTNAEEVLFAASNIASLNAGNTIAALLLTTTSVAITGSAVTKLRGRVITGGVTYTIGSDVTLSSGFGPTRHIAELNPATSLPWTLAEVNAVEIGMQAIT